MLCGWSTHLNQSKDDCHSNNNCNVSGEDRDHPPPARLWVTGSEALVSLVVLTHCAPDALIINVYTFSRVCRFAVTGFR